MSRHARSGRSHDEKLSRALSHLLRHTAERRGIELDRAGYAAWRRVQALPEFSGVAEGQLRRVVRDNDKQRFALDSRREGLFVRANQGHTRGAGAAIDPGALLTPITAATVASFPYVVHGTTSTAWPLIKKTGLNRMKRHHIHMAVGLPGDGKVISGMRASSAVVIRVDVARALAAGIPFFVWPTTSCCPPARPPPAPSHRSSLPASTAGRCRNGRAALRSEEARRPRPPAARLPLLRRRPPP